MTDPAQVLTFWFDECSPEQWFSVNPEFDETIRQRFGNLLESAACCELSGWRESIDGRLAEIIVLDQFSRNAFRGTPRAFAQDPLGLALSQEAVRAGGLTVLEESQRPFLIMPYMHSESELVHEEAVPLFKQWTPESNYDYEIRHKVIIDRFGRYPHRNDILGRESSAEEIEFLKEPNSSF